ncbi:sugar ABC transporter permease [Fodinisporobacter ferrooxydans]|uniref:Sugar ABC transporter permease n=1 Tax=Fodinisporobacter ferrooxydans TaxID=2901836 RepID=A0ABY4CDV5_9BACL|nr:sugar ABC transporter permease [Alicyclobacillaceae bacterium MYW30-H2]
MNQGKKMALAANTFKNHSATSLNKMKRREALTGYVFILPAMILLFVFIILPMLMSIYYSFTDYYLLSPQQKHFVGLSDYHYALSQSVFWQALRNTVYFTVVVVPVQCGVALGLALLANKKLRFIKFFRTAFFSPVVMSMAVVSILWTLLYNPNPDTGLINHFLVSIGLPAQQFLLSQQEAMNSIILMSVWQGAGFQMMIFLAGLQDIPEHLYEAASIDGAGSWRKFLHITLPGLRNVSIVVIITTTIQAFRLIIQPMLMTQGGPVNSTLTLVYFLYQTGFELKDMGTASAIGVMFTIIVVAVALIQRFVLKEEKA